MAKKKQTIEEEIAVHGDYGAEQIQVLEGLEAVRKRPVLSKNLVKFSDTPVPAPRQ